MRTIGGLAFCPGGVYNICTPARGMSRRPHGQPACCPIAYSSTYLAPDQTAGRITKECPVPMLHRARYLLLIAGLLVLIPALPAPAAPAIPPLPASADVSATTRGDAAHTGAVVNSPFQPPFQPAWARALGTIRGE